MEYYQTIQNRTAETVAVINKNLPALNVGGVTAAALSTASAALGGMAQTRDDALAAFDAANNAQNMGFLALQSLTLALPQAAAGDLDDEISAESGLLDLLSPVYAIKPQTTASVMERGKKLVSALTLINSYLTGVVPARAPITSGGRGIAQLTAALADLPSLGQIEENRAADTRAARTALRVATTGLDRLNKRFYSRLQSEARTNPTLAEALSQITTESANLPGTLGIKSIFQGGSGGLYLLLSFENGTYDASATNTVEWMVTATDTDFTHQVPADPSGNTLGPFTAGSSVKLRTRVTNANGTTTGSIRTLVIAPA
jgi:hypothetical protein